MPTPKTGRASISAVMTAKVREYGIFKRAKPNRSSKNVMDIKRASAFNHLHRVDLTSDLIFKCFLLNYKTYIYMRDDYEKNM